MRLYVLLLLLATVVATPTASRQDQLSRYEQHSLHRLKRWSFPWSNDEPTITTERINPLEVIGTIPPPTSEADEEREEESSGGFWSNLNPFSGISNLAKKGYRKLKNSTLGRAIRNSTVGRAFRRGRNATRRGFIIIGRKMRSGARSVGRAVRKIKRRLTGEEKYRYFVEQVREGVDRGDKNTLAMLDRLGFNVTVDESGVAHTAVRNNTPTATEILESDGFFNRSTSGNSTDDEINETTLLIEGRPGNESFPTTSIDGGRDTNIEVPLEECGLLGCTFSGVVTSERNATNKTDSEEESDSDEIDSADSYESDEMEEEVFNSTLSNVGVTPNLTSATSEPTVAYLSTTPPTRILPSSPATTAKPIIATTSAMHIITPWPLSVNTTEPPQDITTRSTLAHEIVSIQPQDLTTTTSTETTIRSTTPRRVDDITSSAISVSTAPTPSTPAVEVELSTHAVEIATSTSAAEFVSTPTVAISTTGAPIVAIEVSTHVPSYTADTSEVEIEILPPTLPASTLMPDIVTVLPSEVPSVTSPSPVYSSPGSLIAATTPMIVTEEVTSPAPTTTTTTSSTTSTTTTTTTSPPPTTSSPPPTTTSPPPTTTTSPPTTTLRATSPPTTTLPTTSPPITTLRPTSPPITTLRTTSPPTTPLPTTTAPSTTTPRPTSPRIPPTLPDAEVVPDSTSGDDGDFPPSLVRPTDEAGFPSPFGGSGDEDFPDVFGGVGVRDRLREIYERGDFSHDDLRNAFNFDPNDYHYYYDYDYGN